jgi:hypothetical protein
MCVFVCVQDPMDIEAAHTELGGQIGEVQRLSSTHPVGLEKLQALLATSGKNRNNHLRKEQISQGVLSTLLRSLGRLVVEQVQTRKRAHTQLHELQFE